MKITLFGATGSLGGELLSQSLAQEHEVTALVRDPQKLAPELRDRVRVVAGDGLVAADVREALPANTQAILFAIGVDEKTSPPDLCTEVTRHILQVMRERDIPRLVWCGGGSNFRPQDDIAFGARFVRWFSARFLNHRHTDKEHQLDLLDDNADLDWLGVRPLQMRKGPLTGEYRLGFNRFSGMSRISFADCAHAMLGMLDDDKFLGKVPIVQY